MEGVGAEKDLAFLGWVLPCDLSYALLTVEFDYQIHIQALHGWGTNIRITEFELSEMLRVTNNSGEIKWGPVYYLYHSLFYFNLDKHVSFFVHWETVVSSIIYNNSQSKLGLKEVEGNHED